MKLRHFWMPILCQTAWRLSVFAAPMTLEESISLALKNSPVLQAESQRNRIAELERSNRASAFYPKLDIESNHGIGQTETAKTTDPWVSSATVKLTETLYDNGESWSRYQQGKEAHAQAQLSFERQRDYLIFEVMQAYYELSRSSKNLESQSQKKKLLTDQFKKFGDEFRQGLKTKRDFLRFKAEAQRAEIEERLASNQLEKQKIELKKLLGVTAFPESEKIEFSITHAEQLLTSIPTGPPKIETTYEVRLAKAAVAIKKYDTNIVERKYWPQLNLSSGAYYGHSDYLNSPNAFNSTRNYGWNVGLELKYNLWDWGVRRREVEIAEANELIADADLRKTELEARSQIRLLMNELQMNKANLEVSSDLLKAQQTVYDMIRRDYTEGRVQYNDLTLSLTGLMDAKLTYYNARYTLAASLARYKYFEGTLYASLKK